jgi:hypothetical protein
VFRTVEIGGLGRGTGEYCENAGQRGSCWTTGRVRGGFREFPESTPNRDTAAPNSANGSRRNRRRRVGRETRSKTTFVLIFIAPKASAQPQPGRDAGPAKRPDCRLHQGSFPPTPSRRRATRIGHCSRIGHKAARRGRLDSACFLPRIAFSCEAIVNTSPYSNGDIPLTMPNRRRSPPRPMIADD